MKSRMYQFYELRDELKKGIASSEAVEKDQKKLVAVLIGAGKANEFKAFIEGIKSAWAGMENDRAALNTRLKIVEQLIEMHEKRDEKSALVNEIATLVLESIGATRPERKSDKTDA